MSLAALLVDLDGTLADTLPVCIEAFLRTVGPRGVELDAAGVRARFGPDERGMLQRLLPPEEVEDAVAEYLAHYGELHASVARPFTGLTELFDELADAGVRVAVVTGKGRESAEISLERLGLARLLEDLEPGSPDGIVKATAITDLLARWKIAARDAAYLGDSPFDVAAAREAGVRALAAAWSPGVDADALHAARPDALFGRVSDLVRWIRRAR